MENNLKSKSYIKRKTKERIFIGAIYCAAIIAIIPLISIVGFILIEGVKALNFDFFTRLPTPAGQMGGGMANALVGSLMIIVLASLIGLPVGIFGGVWLAEYGKGKRGFLIRYSADVLSGIPSIVVGIFVYTLMVLFMRRFSAIAGGVALAIIMIPTITRTTEELVKMVPTSLREAALALGIPEWRVILFIVLRTAWNGIFTGVMLAIARVSGETAPLLFTSFNNQYWNFSFDQPTASMTVQIFNYAISPFQEWHSKAWAGSLTLVLIVLSITLTVRRFSKRISYV